MKQTFLTIFIVAINTTITLAQLSAPEVEDVYGGRINAITGFAIDSDSTRIFISTESANSVFYSTVFANSSSPVFGEFKRMPGLDASAGYGGGIQYLAAHKTSGCVYFPLNNEIRLSHPSSSSVTVAYTGSGLIEAILIIDDYLFFIEFDKLYFGKLDASGNFTNSSHSPLSFSYSAGQKTLFRNPISDKLYLFTAGTTPQLIKFDDKYDAMTSTTSTTSISLSSLSTIPWQSFGIGPDGRLFIMGLDGNKKVAYSDDEISWTEFSTSLNGILGKNIAFSGNSASYYVYSSSNYSTFKGESGTWNEFGNPGGLETHPNDGDVYADPINPAIVYMTTDQGIGASIDNGATIFEIDEGVEAVQVNDFSMTSDKSSAWLASKAGLRKVINYTTSPVWTKAIFPNFDGSPYYSIEMSRDDTMRVFAGNLRIYRSTDNGNSWTQVFTPENVPYNFPSVGTKANAIEECGFSPNIVMAGFEIQGTDKGGLFVSEDYGNTWSQILVETSASGQDIDVADIVFNLEGTDTVAYVGAIYDLSMPQGRSIYRVVKNSSGWTATQDMDATGTAVGYPITATIQDLVVSSSSDTIYATGTDAGINHPITYYKIISGTNLWTTMTTVGYPFSSGKQATAITLGNDTVYVAVDNEIYFFPLGGTEWSLGYSYPFGTEINFLYFDELLAGTSYGLYAHYGTSRPTDVKESIIKPLNYSLEQNYPNPFNPSTTIRFSIPSSAFVTLKIYDLLGQEIETLVEGLKQPGNYSIEFNAKKLASGIYFYKIHAGNFTDTKKFILLK